MLREAVGMSSSDKDTILVTAANILTTLIKEMNDEAFEDENEKCAKEE